MATDPTVFLAAAGVREAGKQVHPAGTDPSQRLAPGTPSFAVTLERARSLPKSDEPAQAEPASGTDEWTEPETAGPDGVESTSPLVVDPALAALAARAMTPPDGVAAGITPGTPECGKTHVGAAGDAAAVTGAVAAVPDTARLVGSGQQEIQVSGPGITGAASAEDATQTAAEAGGTPNDGAERDPSAGLPAPPGDASFAVNPAASAPPAPAGTGLAPVAPEREGRSERVLVPVEQAIVRSVRAGRTEVHLRLDPPELGEVLVKLVLDGAGLRAHLTVTQPEAKATLDGQMDTLRQRLADLGVDVSQCSVDVGDGSAGGSSGQWARDEQRPAWGRRRWLTAMAGTGDVAAGRERAISQAVAYGRSGFVSGSGRGWQFDHRA